MIYLLLAAALATAIAVVLPMGLSAVWLTVLVGLLLWAAFFVAWAVLYLLALLIATLFMGGEKPVEKPTKAAQFFTVETVRMVLQVARIRVHTVGMDKLPQGRFLVVGNHRSNFDPMIGMVLLKKHRMIYISKPGNFRIPIAGRFIYRSGFLAIDRDNVRAAARTIHQAAAYLENDRGSVGIYPEGTRSAGEGLLPFRAGAFKIAQLAKVPVVVLTMEGTEKIHKRFPWRHTDVTVRVAGVISAEEAAGKTTQTADKARALICEALNIEERD